MILDRIYKIKQDEKFYGYLKTGEGRGEAMRLAKNEIKAKYPNPFYWSVFILHGEG